MKTHSKSSLRIFLKEAKQEKPVLAWQLSGYHGEDWSLAQVVWSGADTTQVGESADTINFALSKVKTDLVWNGYLFLPDPFRTSFDM